MLILLQCGHHKIATNYRPIYMTKLIGTQHGYILITITNIQTNLLTSNLANLKLSELNYYIMNC